METKPVWYIQHRENDYDISTQNTILTIKELGMDVYCEKYIPFGGMQYDFLPTDRPVIFIGSITVVRNGLEQGDKFYPCAWCDWKLLTCQSYYTHWGPFLLQQHYGFYPLNEIKRQKDHLFDIFGKDDKLFIRPDANNKEFTGDVVWKGKFDLWWQSVTFTEPPLDILCVVGRPEIINAEYRLIVADGKVIAGSQYRKEGVIEYKEGFPLEMVEFVEEVVKVWSPHPIFCLDVAETPEGFRVVECGSVNCAGYYHSDLRAIIKSMTEIAEREWLDIYQAAGTNQSTSV